MKNFFSLLLALMFSCTFTVCAFAAEPYAENSNPPTLQDTLQEILDNPTYSNAYKEAAKKKCDYLMSVRDSGPSALTRASNSILRFFIFSFLLCIFCKNLTISIVKFQNYYTSA